MRQSCLHQWVSLSYFFAVLVVLSGCGSASKVSEEGLGEAKVRAHSEIDQTEESFEQWSESSRSIIERVLSDDSFHDDLDTAEEKETSLHSEDEDEILLKELAKKDAAFDQVAERLRKRTRYKIPVEINRKVLRWIHYFTVRDRDRYQRFYERGLRYRALINEILEEHQVPKELFYLALIESGFNPNARSHARATGMWQFMKATGRAYGLKISYYQDDRRDPIRATRAAARHLRDLRKNFGSWYLALSAYNAGPRRIKRAIRKGRTRNFWKLAKKRVLPRETMNYVPKFLAAVIIGRDPKRFGFKINRISHYPVLKAMNVPSGILVKDVAVVSGISYKKLKEFNPQIRRGIVPRIRRKRHYPLWVPEDQEIKITQASKAIAKLKQAPIRVRRAAPVRWASSSRKGFYRVRRGDNLYLIAKRHRTSVRKLKHLNRMGRNSKIFPGQRIKIRRRGKTKGYYRVRRGDSLFGISQKFGLSIKKLKRYNQLKRNRIYPGQRLKVQKI